MLSSLDLVVLVLSALMVLCGLYALLMQKTYLDAGGGKETTIKIAGFGSFQSNYPALAFVVLGSALAAWVVHLSYRNAQEVANSHAKAEWFLSGSILAPDGFSSPDGKPIDWSKDGILALEPSDVHPQISPNGQFVIRVSIKQGTPIQEVYPTLIYTNDFGNMQVVLSNELHNYSAKQPTKIHNFEGTVVNFEPLEFQPLRNPVTK
jgi:hypothetical protein